MSDKDRKFLGRFIKNDAPLIDKVTLRGFSFLEICEKPLIYHDNAGRSLIHARWHEEEELNECLRSHDPMKKDVRESDMIPPVLMPIDFTADWQKQVDRASRKSSMRPEDEDDYDYEMELRRHTEKEEAEGKDPTTETGQEANLASEATKEQLGPFPEPSQSASEPVSESEQVNLEVPEEKKELESFKAQKTNLDTIGAAINSINELDTDTDPNDNLSVKIDPDFIPVDSQNTPSGENPEDSAIDAYRASQEEKAASEASEVEPQEVAQETSQEEAPAAVPDSNSDKNLKEATAKTESIIKELESLRKDVLSNIEQNFYEVCQAIAETLLEREFKLNPEAFSKMIKRAIGDSVDGDQFKVNVGSEMYDKLNEVAEESFLKHLVKDESLGPTDFKIDAETSAIDGNIKQIVSDLLSEASIDLFENKDEAS